MGDEDGQAHPGSPLALDVFHSSKYLPQPVCDDLASPQYRSRSSLGVKFGVASLPSHRAPSGENYGAQFSFLSGETVGIDVLER